MKNEDIRRQYCRECDKETFWVKKDEYGWKCNNCHHEMR
jgi:hypothetical protein